MIIDKISNSHLYEGMGELFKKAFDYIKNTDFSSIELGKYELEGKNLYVMIQEYTAKPIEDYKIEAHKNYADIQFIFKGNEKMGYASLNTLIEKVPYNSEKDISFYSGDVEWITVKEGMFGLFLPDDAHAPGIAINEGDIVRKIVMKIKL